MITNTNNQSSLNQIDRNFVDTIINKITLFGQIPYSIPVPMVVEVIKSSARHFYKYHANAWKKSYYVIKQQDILKYAGTDNFQYLGLTVNPKIRIINEIYEANVSDITSISGAMYDSAKYGEKTDSYGASVNNNLYIIEATVKMVEARAMDNMLSSRMPYDYSTNTHELLLKRAPKADLVLDVYMDNEINSLYNDSWFERHVLAGCKKELKRLIAGHTFNLPGGVTVSADEICNGIEDIEKIEDLIKASSGVGDIIMKRK